MSLAREYRSLSDARSALAGRIDRAHAPSLFDRIDWFADLNQHCFGGGAVRIFQAVEGPREAWLFLRPSGNRRLASLSNWYSFSWAPIFLGSPDSAVQQRLLTAIARLLLKDHGQIGFEPLVDESMPLLAALRAGGWFAVRRKMGGAYRLCLNGRDFAAYWAARPGRLRKLVRRKGRGIPFVLSIEERLTDDLWADFMAVQARSWQGPEPGPAFLRTMAARESKAGTLRLGFARQNGRPVAAQLWTVENGVALIHKLAHDRTLDDRSPGTLLSHLMFAQAIDGDRVAAIDYGTGDNAYKAEWMDAREPRYRIDCFNPRYASSWIPAARTAISALVG